MPQTHYEGRESSGSLSDLEGGRELIDLRFDQGPKILSGIWLVSEFVRRCEIGSIVAKRNHEYAWGV